MALKKRKAKKRPAKKRPVKRKVLRKKPVKKKPAKQKRAAVKKIKEAIIGTVTHYFPKVRAAVIKLKLPLAAGDVIKIKGHTTDFTQTVNSMQIDRVPINSAKKGQEIGVLVDSRVRQHDLVYKA
jgi:putative protease